MKFDNLSSIGLDTLPLSVDIINAASAVIVTLMKFCDPEEYELPQLLAEIRKSYPVLSLDIDQNGGSAEQLRTRIQSFREVLEYV